MLPGGHPIRNLPGDSFTNSMLIGSPDGASPPGQKCGEDARMPNLPGFSRVGDCGGTSWTSTWTNHSRYRSTCVPGAAAAAMLQQRRHAEHVTAHAQRDYHRVPERPTEIIIRKSRLSESLVQPSPQACGRHRPLDNAAALRMSTARCCPRRRSAPAAPAAAVRPASRSSSRRTPQPDRVRDFNPHRCGLRSPY